MTLSIETQIAIGRARLDRAMTEAEDAARALHDLGVFGAHVPCFALQKRQGGRTRYWGYTIRGERFVSLNFPQDREPEARVAFQRFFRNWCIKNRLISGVAQATDGEVEVPKRLLSEAATYILQDYSSPEGPAKNAGEKHRARVILVRLVELFFGGATLEELSQARMDRFVAWLSGETVQEVREGKIPHVSRARARDNVRGAPHKSRRARINAMDFRKWLIAFARSKNSLWEPLFSFAVVRKTRPKPIPTRTDVGRVLQVMRYGCRYERDDRDWRREPGFETETGRPIMRRVCDEAFAARARPYLRPTRLAAMTGMRGVDVFAMRYQASPDCGHVTVKYLGAKKRVERSGGGFDLVDDDRYENVVVRVFAKGAQAPSTNKRGVRARLLHGPAQTVLRWERQDESLIKAFQAKGHAFFMCRDAENGRLEDMPNYLWEEIIDRAGLDERFTFHGLKAFIINNMFHRAGFEKKEICARTSTRSQALDASYIDPDEDPEYMGPKNEFAARTPPTSPYLEGRTPAGATLRRDADGRRIAPPASSLLAA